MKPLKGIWYPDGRLVVKGQPPPKDPTAVEVVVGRDEGHLAELGDYLDQLEAYEDLLQRGQVSWQ